MARIDDLLTTINHLKHTIDSHRPLSPSEVSELHKWYRTTYTYHTNALEGNSLTLEETKIIVEDGLTVEGKPVRDVLEAKNHTDALNLLLDLVQKKQQLTEQVLLKLQAEFLKGIDTENAGKYRQVRVRITGEEELPPPSDKIPSLMQELFNWYEKNKTTVHPVVLAAEFHYRFVKIHPFIDGNGRISRLATNIILLQYSYPLIIIPHVLRREYMASLKSTSSKQTFMEFFLQVVLENMKDYLRMIGDTSTPS